MRPQPLDERIKHKGKQINKIRNNTFLGLRGIISYHTIASGLWSIIQRVDSLSNKAEGATSIFFCIPWVGI